MGTKENLEHGARLQLELLETARAVTDLAEVAAGASGRMRRAGRAGKGAPRMACT